LAQTFYPITPVEVTPGTANAWIDVDVSGNIPAGATGVIIHLVNGGSSTYAIGLRKNGSTDNRYRKLNQYSHCWAAIGVDANRIFEAYVGSITGIDIHLIGYTMSGVTFFTSGISKTPTASAWTDIDCSANAPNAVGLIFELMGHDSILYNVGLRKNGSTDDRINRHYGHTSFGAIIGCDDSQICEGYRVNFLQYFVLLGYITDGCTLNTNATDVSLNTALSWLDLTALPSDSVMGFIEVILPSGGFLGTFGLRKNGSAENIRWWPYEHPWAFVECDNSYIIEGYVEDVAIDFFVVGYATKPALPVIGIGAQYVQINPLGINVYGGWE